MTSPPARGEPPSPAPLAARCPFPVPLRCGGAGWWPVRVAARSGQRARRGSRAGTAAVRAAPLAAGRARYPLSKETPPRSPRRRLEQSPPTHAPRGARGLAPGRSGVSARRPRAGSASAASGSERCCRQSRGAIARSAGPVGADEARRAWARPPPWDRSWSGRQSLRALEVPGTPPQPGCVSVRLPERWPMRQGRICSADCSSMMILCGCLLVN